MDELTPLNRLAPRQKGTVRKIQGKGEVHQRLLDMGVVPGAPVEMERVAPLGDPVEVTIKGYHLSLRKEEAANILVAAE
jgi:Fe2+ transport system protein FeoA